MIKLYGVYSRQTGAELHTITLRLDNAADTTYRNHLSYIKDFVPGSRPQPEAGLRRALLGYPPGGTSDGGCSQLISQVTPKRSVTTPKATAQKVAWSGITTVPPSASASKQRQATA